MAIRSQVGKLGKHTIIFGVGSLSSKIAAFLLIPVYTKFLSTEIVGTIALIELLDIFLLGVGSMGIIQAVWRFISKTNNDNKRQIIFTGFIGLILLNVIFLGLLSFAYFPIGQFIGLLGPSGYFLFCLILFNILLQFGIIFQLSLWQFQGKPISFVVLSVSQLIGILILSSYFVINLQLGLEGVIIAKTMILSIIFIFCSINILKNYITIPSLNIFMNLVRFGAPLILLGLSGPILRLSDRFFLNLFIPLSQIGVFSINYKFGMLINMFLVVPLQQGLFPMIYKEGANDDMSPIYRDLMFYYTLIGCLFILGITFFIKPVIEWISTSDYLSSTFIVPLIACAYLIAGFRTFFSPLVALKNRTDLLGKAGFIGICACLIINYVLISQFGITGAAFATIISYFIFSFSIYYLSQKIEPMDWGWLRIGKVATLTAAIIAGVTISENYWNDSELVLGVIGILSFPIFLRVFRIIGEREINGIKSIISFVQNKMRIK